MPLINYKDFKEKDRWFARFQIDTIQDFDNFYRLSKSCNTLCFRTVEEAKFRNYTSIQRSWILQDEKLSKLKGQESILNYDEYVRTLLNKVYENEDVRQFLSDNNIPLNHPVIWAMLQHYGYPTPFLDFSYSIDDSLFLANTSKRFRFLIIMSILTQHIPDKLFKYYSFDEKFNESRLTGLVFLSTPFSFNDPSDCRLGIENNFEEKSRTKDWLYAKLEEVGLNPDDYADGIINNEKAAVDAYWRKQLEKVGILCLSEDDKNKLITPDDVDALVDKLRKFINEPELRKKFSEASYALVTRDFSLASNIEKLKGVYNSLLKGM